MVPINYLAVIASTIVMMVLGFVWYGPIFGKPYSALMGWTPEKMTMNGKGMAKSYILMAIGALIMSFVLAHAVIFGNAYMHTSGAMWGAFIGAMNWLGFIAPVSLGSVIWDGKPWKLWFINAGYYLVGLVLIGMLLAVWM